MPNLPAYEFVLDDSPACHQSLKYWTDRAAEVRNKLYCRFVRCLLSLFFFSRNDFVIEARYMKTKELYNDRDVTSRCDLLKS